MGMLDTSKLNLSISRTEFNRERKFLLEEIKNLSIELVDLRKTIEVIRSENIVLTKDLKKLTNIVKKTIPKEDIK